MKFIENVEKNRYEKFVKNHKKSHFLQSYAWGEFAKKSKNLTPYYVGMEDKKKNLVATALLLEKKLPLGYSSFYSPRGFVIDFFDKELVTEFVEYVKSFVKKKKGIFLKIDPDVIINEENCLGEKVKLNYNPEDVFSVLKGCGFKHLGFTKNFDVAQSSEYDTVADYEKAVKKELYKNNKTKD